MYILCAPQTMHISFLLQAVVVVVVLVAASPTLSLYADVPVARWPFGGSFRGIPVRGAHQPPSGYFPNGAHDFFGDQFDTSFQTDPVDDLNRRITEVRQRCHTDLMLLRRLLQEQTYLLKGSSQDTLLTDPIFRFPLFPDKGTGEEEDQSTSDGFPIQEEVDQEDNFDSTQDLDLEYDSEEDSPTPGPEWINIPYLPEVPDADDLPDNYNNETHAIHVVNGSRVEVNTTTFKETENDITTFFHTEVINILPEEDTEEETPEDSEDTSQRTLMDDEDATEEPVPTVTPEEEENSTEKPPVEEETRNEPPVFHHPIPAAELVAHEVKPVRRVASHPRAQHAAPRSASYVKGARGGPGKVAKPKDLSGDTLVNHIPGNTKTGNTKDPDAEILL